ENSYVVDSRLAWFFLPSSFKIYLQVDIQVAVQRILADPNRNSEQYKNATEAIEKILARKQSENARFLKKYGADCANLHNFDLVIDTTPRTPEEVTALIFKGIEMKKAGVPFPRFL
ncbi:MAG: AAA family ATPase, partial [Saprospiraceae bacterium]